MILNVEASISGQWPPQLLVWIQLLYYMQITTYFFQGIFQRSKTGDQPYFGDTSPYGECAIQRPLKETLLCKEIRHEIKLVFVGGGHVVDRQVIVIEVKVFPFVALQLLEEQSN